LIAIIALDAEDGRELWRHTDLAGRLMFRMCYHDGRVIVPTFAQSEKKASYRHGNWVVACLDAADGKPIWVNGQLSGGSTGGHYGIVLVQGDEVIVGQQSGFGLDLKTGELTRKYDWGQHDNSCADLKCVPGYTMYGLTFINQQGERTVRGQSRSICDTGLFPAYGLLYSSPSACLCAEYINGYHALSADPPHDPMPEEKRLMKGEAYGTVGRATGRKPKTFPASDEWPMHMAGPRRASYTPTAVAGELKRKWSSQAATWPDGYLARDWRDNEQIVGPISAPTVAEGNIFVAAPDAHQILALDSQTGLSRGA
jgi:outer membrane protein assembly factor BamB